MSETSCSENRPVRLAAAAAAAAASAACNGVVAAPECPRGEPPSRAGDNRVFDLFSQKEHPHSSPTRPVDHLACLVLGFDLAQRVKWEGGTMNVSVTLLFLLPLERHRCGPRSTPDLRFSEKQRWDPSFAFGALLRRKRERGGMWMKECLPAAACLRRRRRWWRRTRSCHVVRRMRG